MTMTIMVTVATLIGVMTSMMARMIASMGAIHDCKSGACFQSYITHIGLAEAGGATVMLWPEAECRILRLVYWSVSWVAGLLLAGSLVGRSTGWLDQVGKLLAGWLVGCQVDRYLTWLVGWLVG